MSTITGGKLMNFMICRRYILLTCIYEKDEKQLQAGYNH
jgi:hypothetical protein